MRPPEYYATLGVPPTATPEQIERAYKRLVTISHPDVFQNDSQAQAWANERMKQINEAYAVLSDKDRRSDYNRTYAEWKVRDEPPRQQQRQQTYQRQSYSERLVPCPLCERRGRVPCLTCDGRGSLGCPGCEGRGVVICPLCAGVGTLTETQAREFYEAWERSQQQAKAQAARQEAEAAGQRRAQKERETRRRVAMAGASVLLLFFVARSCITDSGSPAVSSTRQTALVAQPTPYRVPAQPTRRPTPRSIRTAPPSLRSIHSQIPTQLTFRNLTSNPVRVLWIDYEGRERRYRTLAPGESYVQPTFATHPWRLRDARTGRALRTITASVTPSQVVVGQVRRPEPTRKPEATPVPLTTAPLVTPHGPIVRSLTELPTVLQLQTSIGGSGFLFGQPYQAAVLHTNQSGLIMRSVYNLNGEYDRFEAIVGVADNGNLLQRAVVRVLGDGQILFESSTLGSGETPARVSVPIRGVTRLELQTTALPVVLTVIWADPKLIKESR